MKKRRESTEILDWEELEKAPNTRGAFSFLRPQGEVVNIQEHRQSGVEYASGSEGLALADAVFEDVASDPGKGVRKERPYVLRRCITAPHGHSLGENAIYQALYRAGVPDEDDSRRISIGYDRIAHKANLSANAAERGINALIEKLAVDLIAMEDCATRMGRTYRVHSYSTILRRRRAAGLTHAIRDKGVRFVFCPQLRTLFLAGQRPVSSHRR